MNFVDFIPLFRDDEVQARIGEIHVGRAGSDHSPGAELRRTCSRPDNTMPHLSPGEKDRRT